MQAHILSLHTHPRAPRVGSKGQNIFFLKVVMLHIKLKGMEQRVTCKHLFCSVPGVWLKGQNIFFLKNIMLHIKGNGM